jgi:Rho GDP-dissociation inhibitor
MQPPAESAPGAAPAATDGDRDVEGVPAYTAKGPSLAEALGKDADDAAMERYKASLLGGAVPDPNDPETRRVVVRSVALEVAGRPPIVMALDTPEAQRAASAARLVVKEGAEYVLALRFTVHRDTVLGLRWTNVVTRLGLPVDRESVVIGAYAPRREPYEFRLPSAEWPSGLLARGSYHATMTLTDADRATHLSFAYDFDIRKEWPAASG